MTNYCILHIKSSGLCWDTVTIRSITLFFATLCLGINHSTGCNSSTIAPSGFTTLGPGRCVDALNRSALGWDCPADPCLKINNKTQCAAVCLASPGCTGFEYTPASPSTLPSCIILTSTPPAQPATGWLPVNGTQLGTNHDVVSYDNNVTSGFCCYKLDYPNPNPSTNPVKIPPRQSQLQATLFSERSSASQNASEVARLDLLVMLKTAISTVPDLFNSTECPAMHRVAALNNSTNVTPALLLKQYEAEMLVAEYGHGLGTEVTSSENWFSPNYPFLINLFEPCTLGIESSHGVCQKGWGNIYDVIQQTLYGCQPFLSGEPPTSFVEARDRILYTALNFVRSPVGNTPEFGQLVVIMRPSYVRSMMLMTSGDTGAAWGKWHCPNATGWPGCIVGTMDASFQILKHWMSEEGFTIDSGTAQNIAAATALLRDLVCGLHVPKPEPAALPQCRLLPSANAKGSYYEVNALGSILYPDGIKLVVAAYEQYFGTTTGLDIQNWCRRYGWALAWSVFTTSPHYACSDSRRLMDPTVLNATTANVTVSTEFVTAFQVGWSRITQARQNGSYPEALTVVWQTLINDTSTPGSIALFNIGALDCTDGDNCIGMTRNGVCVCYT